MHAINSFTVPGAFLHAPASLPKAFQRFDNGSGSVEADTVRQPAVPVRIVGKNKRGFPFLGLRVPEAQPVVCQVSNEIDAIRYSAVPGDGALAILVPMRFPLEAHGSRVDAPVNFGERHSHRDVASRQPVATRLPVRLRGAPRR